MAILLTRICHTGVTIATRCCLTTLEKHSITLLRDRMISLRSPGSVFGSSVLFNIRTNVSIYEGRYGKKNDWAVF